MNELLVIIVILLIYISIQLSINMKSTSQFITKKDNKQVISVLQPKSHNHLKETCVTHINNVSCGPPILTPRIPINTPTRGECVSYRQLGVLTSNDNTKILPLFGRQIWRGASKWHYSTQTDKLVSVYLPVYKNGRNCSAEYGCDEIYDSDEVEVPQLNETFKVTIYNIDGPRYIPFI